MLSLKIALDRRLLLAALPALLLAGCVRPGPGSSQLPEPSGATGSPEPAAIAVEPTSSAPLAAQLGTPVPEYSGQPTPDAPHYEANPASVGATGTHTVAAGESLGQLAQRYGTTVEELVALNGLTNADVIQVGQALQVPGVEIQQIVSPDFKIIPDSELVYGPAARDFDARAFVAALGGYLLRHSEEVEGQTMDGPAILQLVADRHSVNPRLLLAVLEHEAGWVTQATPASRPAILGYSGTSTPGLYGQLSWAANLLNLGYYGRSEGGLRSFNLGQQTASTQVLFAPTINDGTAGVQRLLAGKDGATEASWREDVGPDGLYATYTRLFGNPFGYTHEPILPPDLGLPPLELPWPAGETWYYTGGPHGAWNSGSAWGALDFVPPAEQVGCLPSDAWVTAMADGVVMRSGNGAVVVDLDDENGENDGYAGTGWAITYMHLETRDRAPLGQRVRTGDRLGHPSCEGGFSNGTHLHITRSYNGRWINADGDRPFEMSGWVSSGAGAEYDGYLTRGDVTREACVCREEVNAIARP
jgi:LysM repeat protein